MQNLPKTLVFLGPQGSGKDTQAKLLAEKFGYHTVDTGTSLREIAKEDSELGRKVKTTIDGGHLVEPDLATEVINTQLANFEADQSVIVIGYPRGVDQYQLLKKTWPGLERDNFQAVYIDITDEEAMKRLLLRAEKENREDDIPEAIEKRLKWSREVVDPMAEKMAEDEKLMRIDGMLSIEEIHQEILKKLNL